jgi:hypothetical protein
MAQQTLVLNGFDRNDPMGSRMSALLGQVLGGRAGAVRELAVGDLKLGYCTGCFGCFVRRPGRCLLRDDARAVLEEIVRSEVLVLTGRIRFGGYSSELKKIVDRVLPVLVPFFFSIRGEMHHPPRYDRLPRIVVVGVPPDAHDEADATEERLFRLLVARNAINLHAPSHACEIVRSGATDEQIVEQLRLALQRSDATSWRAELRPLLAPPRQVPEVREGSTPGLLLVLVGSPKLGPSTSGAIGNYVSERARSHGWQTETLTLRGNLRRQSGRDTLVAAAERADVVCLAFPLYVDALHTLPTRALEILAAERERWQSRARKRLFVVANCGFPEAHQNAVAIAICERFAHRAGWAWSGGLAVGAGEAVCSGEPVDAPPRAGTPPRVRLRRALDLSVDAVVAGMPVPGAAQSQLDRSPIPGLPNFGWRFLYRVFGSRGWRQQARAWGSDPATLRARPLLEARFGPTDAGLSRGNCG